MINKNLVQIFYTNINDNLFNYEYYRSLLNSEELYKADRFYFQKDRNCFTIARAKLREILGEFTETSPSKINFKYNEFNKPFIDSYIKFNISHSKDLIIFAFSSNNDIGIDIEFMKDNIKYKEIINRFFSENEIKEFLNVPEGLQKEAFFNGWSRKESYIKAVGKGLNIPLDSFDVTLDPKNEVKIINIDGKKNNIWKLYDLNINKLYKSAFTTNKEILDFNIFSF